MRDTIKNGAWVALLLGATTPTLADQTETKGGLTVRTDDGRFEFKLGGRFHIDAYAFPSCDIDVGGTSAACADSATVGGMFLRRGYVSLTGKLYGWKFKSEYDLAASSSNPQNTWREAWVATEALGGEVIIGQFKPFRGMEELTSSNEILIMERPYASASSLYGGRQFQMGVGYKLAFPIGSWALSGYNLHPIGNAATEGVGYSTRLTLLPLESERANLHVGLVYGEDNFDGSTGGTSPATIAGRNSSTQVVSPTMTIGATALNGVQTFYAGEVAGAFGPFFFQGEYHNSSLGQLAPASDQDVTSYYGQVSVFVTGETKPYKKDRGTFGSPKPISPYGAWELVARYDTIANDDLAGTAGQPEATQITAGMNWYANPNARLMLNYSMGEGETTDTGTGVSTATEVNAVALRTQLSF